MTLQLPADAPIKKMLFHLSLDSQENCSKMEELNYRIDKLKCLEFSENAEFFFDYFSATYFYFYIVKLISGQIFILNYIGNSNIRNTYSSSFGLCTGALPKVLTNLLFTKIRYGNKYLCTISYFTICNFKFEYATCTATADQLHFDCRILTYFCYLAIHNKAKTFMKSHLSLIYPYSFTSCEYFILSSMY